MGEDGKRMLFFLFAKQHERIVGRRKDDIWKRPSET